jgi:hypothetical protein
MLLRPIPPVCLPCTFSIDVHWIIPCLFTLVSSLPPLGLLSLTLGGPCLFEELKWFGKLMLIDEMLLPTLVTLQFHATTLHQTLILLWKVAGIKIHGDCETKKHFCKFAERTILMVYKKLISSVRILWWLILILIQEIIWADQSAF